MANEKCLSYSGYRQPNHWCERGDSNPHTLRYQILSLARLPIPPLSHTRKSLPSMQRKRISREFMFVPTQTRSRKRSTGLSELTQNPLDVSLCELRSGTERGMLLKHPVGCLGLSEKIFSHFLFDQPGAFKFEVSPLDFTTINCKLLGQGCRGGKSFA